MSEWNPSKARELIEARGLTRRYIAKRCGLKTVRSLHNILLGRKPGGATLILLAQTLGTTPEDLAGSQDDNPKDAA